MLCSSMNIVTQSLKAFTEKCMPKTNANIKVSCLANGWPAEHGWDSNCLGWLSYTTERHRPARTNPNPCWTKMIAKWDGKWDRGKVTAKWDGTQDRSKVTANWDGEWDRSKVTAKNGTGSRTGAKWRQNEMGSGTGAKWDGEWDRGKVTAKWNRERDRGKVTAKWDGERRKWAKWRQEWPAFHSAGSCAAFLHGPAPHSANWALPGDAPDASPTTQMRSQARTGMVAAPAQKKHRCRQCLGSLNNDSNENNTKEQMNGQKKERLLKANRAQTAQNWDNSEKWLKRSTVVIILLSQPTGATNYSSTSANQAMHHNCTAKCHGYYTKNVSRYPAYSLTHSCHNSNTNLGE